MFWKCTAVTVWEAGVGPHWCRIFICNKRQCKYSVHSEHIILLCLKPFRIGYSDFLRLRSLNCNNNIIHYISNKSLKYFYSMSYKSILLPRLQLKMCTSTFTKHLSLQGFGNVFPCRTFFVLLSMLLLLSQWVCLMTKYDAASRFTPTSGPDSLEPAGY